MSTCILIPARLKSKRIFNKPLYKINNETILNLTIKKCLKVYDHKNIFVITDSSLVRKSCLNLVQNVLTFKKKFLNGTERCSYAVDFINKKFDKFIIISCDMPYFYPKTINFLEKKFRENYIKKKNTIITIHKKTKSKKDLNNKNIVKIAVTKNNNILYFSRAKIPSNYKKVSPEIFCTHHGIVMLDRYNRNLENGLNITDAVIKAGTSRFRAIILTTITTFVGLAPLIMEKSFQAQFLVPMAISVAFGVLFGTIILLLYFPSLILYFNDIRRARLWLWNGGNAPPAKIEVEPVTKLKQRQIEIEK